MPDFSLRAVLEIADQPRQIPGKEKPIAPGHVFAERDQVNLVINKIQFASGAQQRRTVIRSALSVAQRLEVDHTH